MRKNLRCQPLLSAPLLLEATGGIEPPNRGFANPCLNHLATSPLTYARTRSTRTSLSLIPDSPSCNATGLATLWCALRACCALLLVPRVGLEPTRPFGHYALNVACLPISASRRHCVLYGIFIWQERQDSNPRPLVLETNALAN